MNTRRRNWTVTLHEEEKVTAHLLKTYIKVHQMKYWLCAHHIGEKNEREHYHLVLCTVNAVRFKNVKESFPTGHIETIRDLTSCIDYCKTGATDEKGWCEQGTPPAKCVRTDYVAVRTMCKDKKSLRQIADSINSYPALKTAERLIRMYEPKRDFMPITFWFYGPTGSGKSKIANIISKYICEEPYFYHLSSKFFQDYDQNEAAIFDDFRSHEFPLSSLLRLLDRYPMTIEVKGSSRQFLAKGIFITTDRSIKKTYNYKGDRKQLRRRIMLEIKFPKKKNLMEDGRD